MEPRSFSSDRELLDFLHGFCKFGKNRLYLLSAMARPKENPSISHNSIPIFREIIAEQEDLWRKLSKLQSLSSNYIPEEGCEQLKFRLYITTNARNAQKSFFQFQKNLIGMQEEISNGHEETMWSIKRLDKEWKSILQREGSKEDKYFIIDIDDNCRELFDTTASKLSYHTDIIASTETPNGFHIITEPFNYNQLEILDERERIELKTDGLTFLTFL